VDLDSATRASEVQLLLNGIVTFGLNHQPIGLLPTREILNVQSPLRVDGLLGYRSAITLSTITLTPEEMI
ncbi:MAG TPA: hypothetical protein VMG63_25655, partial [Terriglobia bacterium]|nr:hypothetical protein [Terriglobia bacterium]